MEQLSIIISNISILAALCFVLGFIFIVIEMFHPGFGAPGIIGVILLFLGVLQSAKTLLQASIMIIIILSILGVALTLVLHSAAKGRLSKTLILTDESDYIRTSDMEYFLGREGIALSVLRPSGVVDFDGVKLDVVSCGGFIAKGKKVKIIKVEGRKIVVDENE